MEKRKRIEGSFIVQYSNYIVRDHQIRGIRVMPGVTFLDTLYRIALSANINDGKIKLSDIVFERPIALEENKDRNVTFALEPKEGYWDIEIKSQNVDHSDKEETNLHGKLAEIEKSDMQTKHLDIETLKKNAIRVVDMDEQYKKVREFGVTHYEFMKTIGTVYEGDDYILAHLHTGEFASQYQGKFYIHPALMDASTIVALGQIETAVTNEKKNPFIPLYIKEFYADKPTKGGCYVYLEHKKNRSTSKNLLYTTYEVYAENGTFIAYFDQLAAAEVRNTAGLVDHEEMKAETSESILEEREEQGKTESSDRKTNETHTKNDIEELLKQMIARMLKRGKSEISSELDFYQQGMDSTNLLALVKELEAYYQIQLYPTLLFEYSNINELAGYLYENVANTETLDLDAQQFSETKEAVVEEKEKQNVCYFKPVWNRKDAEENMSGTGTVLLVNPGSYTAQMIEEYWEHTGSVGKSLITIQGENEFTKNSSSSFTINFSRESDYEKVLEALDRQNIKIQQTLYISGTDADENKCVEFMLLFTKVWQKMQAGNAHRITVLASGMESSNKANILASAGFFRTVIQENPKWYFNVVDAGNMMQQSGVAAVSEMILTELKSKDSNLEIAYREQKRYVKQYELLEKRESVSNIREGGVYFVTGGTGGLGKILSNYLVENYNARVIATSRTARQDMHNQSDKITYIQADVTDRNQTERMIQLVKEQFGQINGVIHCAGKIKDVFSRNNTLEDAKEVMNPKMEGVKNLYEFLSQDKLDFVVYCSSTTAEMGNVGQSVYGYANSFLDHFAAYQQKENQGIVSINWPYWKDGGMQADQAALEAIEKQIGITSLQTENGLKALEDALAYGIPQILVIQGMKERIIKMMEEKNKAAQFVIKEAMIQKAVVQKEAAKKPAISYSDDDIAIIGIAGRYPKADNLEEFWNNLCAGKDCITEIPLERWDNQKYYDKSKGTAGTTYSKWGGFVNDIDRFDALFFNMPPQVAKFTDPQERLFLETAWEAMEDSGYTRNDLSKARTGVFVGVMWAQYQLYREQIDGRYVSPTCLHASIANRTSYVFNLTGPSISLDTMCSSSITSIHLACDSLRKGECNMVIAGGVNLTPHPNKYVFLSQQGFAASDGRCHTFGEGGDGYVPGEGVGAVILKKLSDAVRDHDQIYAVIKGSSINAGGRTSGYTVPSSVEQGNVIRETLDKCGISARTIGVLEAHGTGTGIGDPIEMGGLIRAYKKDTQDKQFCSIGSVKSNIGHLESAAGIAAVTKVVLEMKYNKLVPSLHSKVLNPNIDFANSPFTVQQTMEDWKKIRLEDNGVTIEYPRRAGISAFGAGGSNAHIILEQYEKEQEKEVQPKEAKAQIFVLSAKSEDRLFAYAKRYITFLSNGNVSSENQKKQMDRAVVENQIQEMASKMLSISSEALDMEESLLEYGMDKVAINQLHSNLRETYQVKEDDFGVFENSSIRELAEYICNHSQEKNVVSKTANTIDFDSLIFTSQCGREQMEERLAIVASNQEELCQLLNQFVENPTGNGINIFHGNIRKSKEINEILGDDELGTQIMEQLQRTHNYAKIAKMWTLGCYVDFASMYQGRTPGRISLPTYPFLKNRYWIEDEFDNHAESETRAKEKKEEVILDSESSQGKEIKDAALFYSGWEAEERTKAEPDKSEQKVLIVGNQKTAAEEQSIRKYYAGSFVYRIDTDSYDQLRKMPPPDIVYYLGAMNRIEANHIELEVLEEQQMKGSVSLFALIKELDALGAMNKKIAIKVLTYNVYRVLDEKDCNPFAAGMNGILRTLVKEYEHVEASYMDFAQGDPVEDIIQEAVLEKPGKQVKDVAFRNGRRYVKNLIPIKLEQKQKQKTAFRNQGVYIIAGGTGSVGMDVAKYLLKYYDANVILLGRSDKEKVSERLESLNGVGGRSVYMRCDITDQIAFQKLIDTVKAQYGTINGMIDSAVVYQEKQIHEMSNEEMKNLMKTKTVGTMVIYKVLKEEKLDFMVFFSSGQSMFQNVGRSHYAAGCCFQDAFGQSIQKTVSYPVKVMNWGFWGKANGVSEEKMRQMFEAQGVNRLDPEECINILDYFLCSEINQVFQIDVKDYVYRLMDINFQRSYQVYDRKSSSMYLLNQNPAGEKIDDRSEDEITCISEFTMTLLVQKIKQTGMIADKESGYTVEELKKAFRVEACYERLFEAILDILVSGGYLKKENNRIYSADLSKVQLKRMDELEQYKQECIQKQASTASYLNLLWVCINSLIEILAGDKIATDVIFPNGSAELVEGVYKDNDIAKYANEIVVECVRKYVEEKASQNEKVKILEIGAGTGGTSAKIFEALEPFKDQVEYMYTDISLSFLQYGKRAYLPDRPYLRFELLNIEKNVEESKVELGEYDLVIAANVLHATKDMKTAIQNAKMFMKDKGWIILNEATENFIFLTLTFGLLDGWWYYQDEDIRIKNSPLLSPQMWNQVLQEEGFQDVRIYRNIIIGESNGVVTKKQVTENKKQERKVSKPKQKTAVKSKEDVLKKVTNVIADSIKKALMLEENEMDYDSSFMDYGVDSILSIKIVNAIQEALQIELSSTELFDYPSVNELAAYLTKEYYDKISQEEQTSEHAVKEEEVIITEADDVQEPLDMLEILKRLEENTIDVELAQQLLGGELDE